MKKLNEIPDKELCELVHNKENPTGYEIELMTRLIERNAGAKEKADVVIELDLDNIEPMISVRRAIITCAVFLLAQAVFFVYFMPCV